MRAAVATEIGSEIVLAALAFYRIDCCLQRILAINSNSGRAPSFDGKKMPSCTSI